jgi:signal peptidase I
VEVHDESMRPTLEPGDRLLVDSAAYRDRPPETGDLVVLMDPQVPDRWLVKRVAGVGPGRFWRTHLGLVRGGSVPGSPDPTPPPDAVEPVDLDAKSIFVVGDSPSARDSRRFGPVPRTAIVGRAYRCYAPPARRREL